MSEVTTNEYNEDGKMIRKIRSFVRREGRLTIPRECDERVLPTMGIDYKAELLDWKEVFGNDNPVVLEIGFGMGASLVEMAKNAPEKNFIGIEVHSPGVGACLADAREAGITNLRVMCHDAVEVFEHMIPNGSLATLQLFFPDPWHKSVTTSVVSYSLSSLKWFVRSLSLMKVSSTWRQTGKTTLST